MPEPRTEFLDKISKTPVFMRHNPLCVIIPQSSMRRTIPVAFISKFSLFCKCCAWVLFAELERLYSGTFCQRCPCFHASRLMRFCTVTRRFHPDVTGCFEKNDVSDAAYIKLPRFPIANTCPWSCRKIAFPETRKTSFRAFCINLRGAAVLRAPPVVCYNELTSQSTESQEKRAGIC